MDNELLSGWSQRRRALRPARKQFETPISELSTVHDQSDEE